MVVLNDILVFTHDHVTYVATFMNVHNYLYTYIHIHMCIHSYTVCIATYVCISGEANDNRTSSSSH